MSAVFDLPYREAKRAFMQNYLLHHLQRNRWDMTRTAKFVGLDRSTLYENVKRFGVRQMGGKR